SSDFAFARDFGREYLTRLCHVPPAEEGASAVPAPIPPPPADELGAMALRAPPMRGLEYLSAEVMAAWWMELDALVREEAAAAPGRQCQGWRPRQVQDRRRGAARILRRRGAGGEAADRRRAATDPGRRRRARPAARQVGRGGPREAGVGAAPLEASREGGAG